jgi:hypothetical protein
MNIFGIKKKQEPQKHDNTIISSSPLSFQNLGTLNYISMPKKRLDNWEAGVVKEIPSGHYIIPDKKTEASPIMNGEKVRIKSQDLIQNDDQYNCLYATPIGNVLYDRPKEDTPSQIWTIKF